MSVEFRGVGLLEQRPPVQEVRLAHHEGLIRGDRLAMGDPSTLGLMVHRHVHELTGRARRRHQPADRGPLVTRPASEIQDHVRSQLQRLKTQPEQPSFQHIALPGRLRIAEQREHPLIRRQPQRVVFLGQLSSSRGLPGPGQADRQEQRRHAQSLSRRPSDHGLNRRRIEATVTVPWKTRARLSNLVATAREHSRIPTLHQCPDPGDDPAAVVARSAGRVGQAGASDSLRQDCRDCVAAMWPGVLVVSRWHSVEVHAVSTSFHQSSASCLLHTHASASPRYVPRL